LINGGVWFGLLHPEIVDMVNSHGETLSDKLFFFAGRALLLFLFDLG
jgi:hypothetical protein